MTSGFFLVSFYFVFIQDLQWENLQSYCKETGTMNYYPCVCYTRSKDNFVYSIRKGVKMCTTTKRTIDLKLGLSTQIVVALQKRHPHLHQ